MTKSIDPFGASQVSDIIHYLTFCLELSPITRLDWPAKLFSWQSLVIILLDLLCLDTHTRTGFHFEILERKPAVLVKVHSLPDQDMQCWHDRGSIYMYAVTARER